MDEPGELIAQAVVYSKRPFQNDQHGKPIDARGVWLGESRSEEVHIKLVEPTGDDLEIQKKYKTWKPDERSKIILEKYPLSTYAAYMLWGGAYSSAGGYDGSYSYLSRPQIPEDDYQGGQKFRSEYLACQKCMKGMLDHYQTITDSWERLLRDFPDFPYRKQALFGLARAYIQTGTPEKAAPLLSELMKKFPDSDEAKKAPVYLATLKKHGV